MPKTIRSWLCLTLSALMAFTVLVFPARACSADPYSFSDREPRWIFSDTEGHWAEAEIIAASTDRQVNGDCWVNGYPDGTFRPDADVTRAEYVKMLLAAMNLFSYSDTAKYLHEVSSCARSGEAPADMENHWLTMDGWTQTALDFGLILPSDYPNGAFLPNRSATRYEAAVMTVRALGLVYPAKNSAEKDLPFTDADAIPQSLRGYVYQAAETGVLTGCPDGSFQGDKTVTRAEAVTMITRALEYMEQGVDPDIWAFAEESSDHLPDEYKQRLRIWTSVPAQVIDGVVYLPARDVVAANTALYNTSVEWSYWDAENQQLAVCYVDTFLFGAGDTRFSRYSGDLSDYSPKFSVPARLLYGEVMIPFCAQGGENPWWGVQWDAAAKRLIVSMQKRYAHWS